MWNLPVERVTFVSLPLCSMARSRKVGSPMLDKNFQDFIRHSSKGRGEDLKHCITCIFRNCNYFAILPTNGQIICSTDVFICGHLAHKQRIVLYSTEFQGSETGICPTLHPGRLMYICVETSSIIPGGVDMLANFKSRNSGNPDFMVGSTNLATCSCIAGQCWARCT